MSRSRYFDGAVPSELPTARPMRSAVRCEPEVDWSFQRRLDSSRTLPPVDVANRPRCTTGNNFISAIEASTVTPATMTKVRKITVIGFIAASHLDLGDAPDREEADHFHDHSSQNQ